MTRFAALLTTLAALALLAPPADATEYEDMDLCLGTQIVARALCKEPYEVNYVSKVKDNIYLFSVFYANRPTHFFVGVYDSVIRIQGREYQTVTRTIPYQFDDLAKCGIVDFSSPECPTGERIICCSQKTAEEELDDTFWNRPIPELLEEDLRRAIQGDNATDDGQ